MIATNSNNISVKSVPQNITFYKMKFVVFLLWSAVVAAIETTNVDRAKYAEIMKSYMNLSVDPCDDFYEYACGNYFNVNEPLLGIGVQSALLNIENQEIEAFREILMEPAQPGNATVFNKVKNAYQACMKEDVFAYKKSDAFLEVIDSLGGWPALNPNWKPEDFNWLKVMKTFKKFGVDVLVNVEVDTDKDFLIQIKPKVFGLKELSSENLNRISSRAYQFNKKMAMRIMDLYGIPKKDAIKAFSEIVKFGKEVAFDETEKLIIDLSSLVVQGFTNIENITKELPDFEWTEYFASLAGRPINTTAKNIYILPAIVFQKILKTLKKKDNIRGAANYAMLKLLYELHKEFRSAKYPERFCFFQIQKYMNTPANYLYSQSSYYSKENEDETWTVFNYIKSAYKDTIESLDWMDEESKRRAVAKLENMEIYIGYSNTTWNPNELEEEFKDVDIYKNDYFKNVLSLRRHSTTELFKPLVSNKISNVEYVTPLLIDLNAFYDLFKNKLIIPSVLLVQPCAYPGLPKAYNFGSIGRSIGHELVHGFDSVGKIFNEFGELDLWWSNDTIEAYRNREKCLENQYSSFLVPEMYKTIDGEESIQENIADNGGIRQSYYGYKKWLNENQNDENPIAETLPGLNLTSEQLFFLSFGQMFCTRYNNRKAYKNYLDSTYALEKYRLIGSLKNFNEFSKTFNCKEGTPMNPDKKCILW